MPLRGGTPFSSGNFSSLLPDWLTQNREPLPGLKFNNPLRPRDPNIKLPAPPEVQDKPTYDFKWNGKLYKMPLNDVTRKPSDTELAQWAYESEQGGAYKWATSPVTNYFEEQGKRFAEPLYRAGEKGGPYAGLHMGLGAGIEGAGKATGDVLATPLSLATFGGGELANIGAKTIPNVSGVLSRGLQGRTGLTQGIGKLAAPLGRTAEPIRKAGKALEMGGSGVFAGHGMYDMYGGYLDEDYGRMGKGALDTALGGLGAYGAYTRGGGGPAVRQGEIVDRPQGQLGPGRQPRQLGAGDQGGFSAGPVPPIGPQQFLEGDVLGDVKPMGLPRAEGLWIDRMPRTGQDIPPVGPFFQGGRGVSPEIGQAQGVGRMSTSSEEAVFNAQIPERYKPPSAAGSFGIKGPYDYQGPPAFRGAYSEPAPEFTPPSKAELAKFPKPPTTGLEGRPTELVQQWAKAGDRRAIAEMRARAKAMSGDVGPVSSPVEAPIQAQAPIPAASIPTAPIQKAPIRSLGEQLGATPALPNLPVEAAKPVSVSKPVPVSKTPKLVPEKYEPSKDKEIQDLVDKLNVAIGRKAAAPVSEAAPVETKAPIEAKAPVAKAKPITNVEIVSQALDKIGRKDLAADLRAGKGKFNLKARDAILTPEEAKDVAERMNLRAPAAPVAKVESAIDPTKVTPGRLAKGDLKTGLESVPDAEIIAKAKAGEPRALTEASRHKLEGRIRPTHRETASDVVKFKKQKPTAVSERRMEELTKKFGGRKGEIADKEEFETKKQIDSLLELNLARNPEDARKMVVRLRADTQKSRGETKHFKSLSDVGEEGLPKPETSEDRPKSKSKKKIKFKFGSQTEEKGTTLGSGFDPVEETKRAYKAAKSGWESAREAYKKSAGPTVGKVKEKAARATEKIPGVGKDVVDFAKEVRGSSRTAFRSTPDMLKYWGQSGLTTLEKMGKKGRELGRLIQRARIEEDQLAARYEKELKSRVPNATDDQIKTAAKRAQNETWDKYFRSTEQTKEGKTRYNWEKLDRMMSGTENQTATREIVNKHFGRTQIPGKSTVAFSKAATEIETALKLSQFAISNFANIVMTVSKANGGAMLKAAGKMAKDMHAAVGEARETGALQTILAEIRQELGVSKRIGKLYGIEKSEELQRTFASIAGKHTADDLFTQVKAGKGGVTAERRLKELLLTDDLQGTLRQTKLTETQRNMAGNRMSEITQGRAGSIDLPPGWSSHPLANLVFQFKRFAFTQSKNIKEAMKIDPVRTLATMAIGGQVAGGGIGMTKDAINSIGHSIVSGDSFDKAYKEKRERRTKGFGGIIASNYADAWAFGLIMDFTKSFGRGEAGFPAFLAGPTLQDVGRLGSSVWEGQGNEILRQGLETIPMFGRGMAQGKAPKRTRRNPMFATD